MKDKELDFEKALAELEATVGKLESGGLGLSESLALFEKGVKLARFLRTELERAEKKVEILLKDEKGDLQAHPFDLDEEEAPADAEEPSGSEDDAADPSERKARPRAPRKKPEGGGGTLPF